MSCAERPQKEIRQVVAAFFNEPIELLRVEAEQDHQYRPRGEREHAQREQVDEELFGGNRPQPAGPDRGFDLLSKLEQHSGRTSSGDAPVSAVMN